MTSIKKMLLGMTQSDLEVWMKENSFPSYRAAQVLDWLWKKGFFSFYEMKNLGIKLQTILDETFLLQPLVVQEAITSETEETTKYLFRLHDGACIESVLIRAPRSSSSKEKRMTLCVSSQVGCPARCSFCASGKKGLIRNLETAEIISQVLLVHHSLLKKEGQGIDHIVYMGMGEPLENYDHVVRSITMLNSDLFGISQRKITLSTVGVVDGLRRLAREGLRINLAFSLHAPTQEIRQKIIPYARKYDLDDIIESIDAYQKATGRDITFEYTLIDGINSEIEHARRLVALIGKKQCSLNLIPYNPIEGLSFSRPSREKIKAFCDIVEKAGIPTTCRYTKGDDIAAACGQLALREFAL